MTDMSALKNYHIKVSRSTIEHVYLTVEAESTAAAREIAIQRSGDEPMNWHIDHEDRMVEATNTGEFSRANRVAKASVAIHAAGYEDDDTAVLDLLADLRHYCDASNIDFTEQDNLARRHYVEEMRAAIPARPLPDAIKAARKSAGLTIVEAAALVHVTKSAWLKWEGGQRPMTPATWELFRLKLAGAV